MIIVSFNITWLWIFLFHLYKYRYKVVELLTSAISATRPSNKCSVSFHPEPECILTFSFYRAGMQYPFSIFYPTKNDNNIIINYWFYYLRRWFVLSFCKMNNFAYDMFYHIVWFGYIIPKPLIDHLVIQCLIHNTLSLVIIVINISVALFSHMMHKMNRQ